VVSTLIWINRPSITSRQIATFKKLILLITMLSNSPKRMRKDSRFSTVSSCPPQTVLKKIHTNYRSNKLQLHLLPILDKLSSPHLQTTFLTNKPNRSKPVLTLNSQIRGNLKLGRLITSTNTFLMKDQLAILVEWVLIESNLAKVRSRQFRHKKQRQILRISSKPLMDSKEDLHLRKWRQIN
jgi:hypothetical protein